MFSRACQPCASRFSRAFHPATHVSVCSFETFTHRSSHEPFISKFQLSDYNCVSGADDFGFEFHEFELLNSLQCVSHVGVN